MDDVETDGAFQQLGRLLRTLRLLALDLWLLEPPVQLADGAVRADGQLRVQATALKGRISY
jgi:hypothetical protein